MIFRLRTKSSRARQSYVFEALWATDEKASPGPHVGQYENLFHDKNTISPELVVEHLTETVDPSTFPRRIKVHAKPKGNDSFSPDFLLDYLFGQFPVVTEAFRGLVEETDPGVHQFVPVKLVWSDENEVPVTLFHFVCGRNVDLNTAGVAPWSPNANQSKHFFMPRPEELKLLPALLAKPDAYGVLDDFPIWTFKRNRAEKYISQAFLNEAHARNLKGFELSNKKTIRDIQPVARVRTH